MMHTSKSLLVLVTVALAAVAHGEDKKHMPLTIVETLTGSNAMAFQAAAGGGVLKPTIGREEFHLTLHQADNMTAVMKDPSKAEFGIQMVPHASMRVVLPAFAVLLANLSDSAEIEESGFQVVAVNLKELVSIESDGKLTYKVEVIDSDMGTDARDPAQADISSEKELTAAKVKRSVPEMFHQASVLIDLVDVDDKENQAVSIRQMAESGELAHNIQNYLTKDPSEVQGQGVLTIGWMLPWSLWAWVCCPTFFVLMPWAVPLWVFCCI